MILLRAVPGLLGLVVNNAIPLCGNLTELLGVAARAGLPRLPGGGDGAAGAAGCSEITDLNI